ncbi:hypothetical protein ND486_11575 [Pseudonocardia sp. DR1-2]|uniref:hypothetical protein n=1 Tax=Pseudonocardia sp. DR1-2 TaxID=2951168 RepID=UPI00204443D1|nr:hypothetical protein [Pseudonocardia sp. DR1-2]MCM3846829.1 hypothetical protein [Pseudonocardia sp. DR1-2]
MLVTIDDLEALFQILRAQTPDTDDVHARFNGGYFDDANDIRSLSDGELSFLAVDSMQASITLSPQSATVVSPNTTIRAKVVHWASVRQTTSTPPRGRLSGPVRVSGLELLIIVIAVVLVLPFVGSQILGLPEYPALFSMAASGVVFISAAMGALFSRQRGDLAIPKSYAIIEPRTMAEFRDRRRSEKHPIRANTIALVALLVGAAGVGVAVWAIFAQQ